MWCYYPKLKILARVVVSVVLVVVIVVDYRADPKLAKWVFMHRHYYNNNELPVERINRLESISFVWDLHNSKWTEMYDQLVAYKKISSRNKCHIDIPKIRH